VLPARRQHGGRQRLPAAAGLLAWLQPDRGDFRHGETLGPPPPKLV